MSHFPRSLAPAKKTVHVVGLNALGAAWLAPGSLGSPPQWSSVAWGACTTASSVSAALKSVVQLVDPLQAQRIAWVLAPSLMRCWVHAPSLQIASLAELQAVAQARANQLFGGAASPTAPGALWEVAAQWHASRPFLCMASPSLWARALHELVNGDKKGQILSPLTLALERFHQQIPANGWLAIAGAGELGISHWIDGRMRRLRSVRLPLGCTPATARALAVTEWRRELLRSQGAGNRLDWLCLMPGSSEANPLPELRPIEWTPSERLPAPASAGALDGVAEGQAALNEAILTAWSGQQLSEGAAR